MDTTESSPQTTPNSKCQSLAAVVATARIEIPVNDKNEPYSPPPSRLSAKRDRLESAPNSVEKTRLASERRQHLTMERQRRITQHLQHVENVRSSLTFDDEKKRLQTLNDSDTRLYEAEQRRLAGLERRATRAAIMNPFNSPLRLYELAPSMAAASPSPSKQTNLATASVSSSPPNARRFLQFSAQANSSTKRKSRGNVLIKKKPQQPTSNSTQGCDASSEDEAATSTGLISLAYRIAQLRKLARETKLLDDISTKSFEEATVLIQSEAAKNFATLLFQSLLDLALHETHLAQDEYDKQLKQHVRIFLSSFIIALHPDHVLDHPMSDNTTPSRAAESVITINHQVQLTAQTLVTTLISLVGSSDATTGISKERKDGVESSPLQDVPLTRSEGNIQASPSAEVVLKSVNRFHLFRKCWIQFFEAFQVWKRQDAEALIQGMIQDAVVTNSLRNTVENAPEYHGEIWDSEISKKLDMIEHSLKRIGGLTAVQRMREEITKDQDRKRLASLQQNEILLHELLVEGPELLERAKKRLRTETGYLPVSQQEQTRYRSLEALLEDGLNTTLWESLAATLKSTPRKTDEECSNRVNGVLRDMIYQMEKMLESSAARSKLTESRNDVQVDSHGLWFEIDRITKHLASLQSPSRDAILEEWREKWKTRYESQISQSSFSMASMETLDALIQALKELSQMISEVKVECSIARIERLLPIVATYGPDVERQRLARFYGTQSTLDGSQLRLLNTAAWLESSLAKHSANYRKGQDSQDALLLGYVVAQGLINLVDSAVPVNSTTVKVPEVLGLDIPRLHHGQNQLQLSIILSCVANILKSFLSSSFPHTIIRMRDDAPSSAACLDLSPLQALLHSESASLENICKASFEIVESVLIGHDLLATDFTEAQRKFVAGLVDKVCREDDTLYGVFRRRCVNSVYRFLTDALQTADENEKISKQKAPALKLKAGLGSATLSDSSQPTANVDHGAEPNTTEHQSRLRSIMESMNIPKEAVSELLDLVLSLQLLLKFLMTVHGNTLESIFRTIKP